jgi:hypothetical protein
MMAFHSLPISFLWLPLVWVPLVLGCLSLTWLLAALGVFLRDIGQVVGVVVSMLMFLSPIFFPVSALPLRWQPLLALNPLAQVIEQTRQVVVAGKPHQTCLKKLQAAGAHISAEHDVHESYSGDGLIAASFRSEDRDLTVELSHNRYSTTLFPNPAVHLADSIREVTLLRRQVAELEAKQANTAAAPRTIKQMLKAFLPNG